MTTPVPPKTDFYIRDDRGNTVAVCLSLMDKRELESYIELFSQKHSEGELSYITSYEDIESKLRKFSVWMANEHEKSISFVFPDTIWLKNDWP